MGKDYLLLKRAAFSRPSGRCGWLHSPLGMPINPSPSVRKIAARFGVNPGTVQRINRPFGESVASASR